MEGKADEKKAKGNEEFKKGNYAAAITYYTDAIELCPNEVYFTNRAMAQIKLKK